MKPPEQPIEHLLRDLQERAKELDCLYRIEEILKRGDLSAEETVRSVIEIIPAGWQYPAICQARITLGDKALQSPDFVETMWVQCATIHVQGEMAGCVEVSYRESAPLADEGPFLTEERRLIDTIAGQIGHYLERRKLERAFAELETARRTPSGGTPPQWDIVLKFLKSTDRVLLTRISRKMLNHLAWSGIEDAEELLNRLAPGPRPELAGSEDENRPLELQRERDSLQLADETFRIAGSHLGEQEILACIQRWIREDRARFLVNALENPDTSLAEIRNAIDRYHHLGRDTIEFSQAAKEGSLTALIRRFLSDQMGYVSTAKRFLEVDDFFDLVSRMIFMPRSHGRLGGKSAGLFLAAQILKKDEEHRDLLGSVKVPRTWFLTSDAILAFIAHNNLEDVFTQKYVDIDQVRLEYPHLVQVFKRSQFPPEIVEGLALVLDETEGKPLIVRSSSLLEDRLGAAFSGKYKSLFLANNGSKERRLSELLDAIAEVYASTFGPDPIEYRSERGLIDVHEEMAIMIQEVVGARVGNYFLPAFSGVAFTRNEFRWSARVRREDGLVRLVPGLGTRAVDRLKDDYPILLAPGQPKLRVNVTPDEVVKYSPKKVDVINLETGQFETVEVQSLLSRFGDEYPGARRMVSILDQDWIRRPFAGPIDFEKEKCVVTFDGLVDETPFIAQMRTILKVLEEKLGVPVDIEFASDGVDFYLLQCRPQSYGGDTAPAPIPRDIPEDRIIFSARKYVSNGRVPRVTHIVYVDPEKYEQVEDLETLKAFGRAVGRLNNILPKRQFILMGPGRWGSRGDVKLGVNVTYSDINNAALLVEIARKRGGYVPDLSFGTHFFQDLVESGIRYLPLYPDDEGIVFNTPFLTRSTNTLSEILPEFAFLEDALRVVDVQEAAGGRVLCTLMNGDLDEAVGVLVPPEQAVGGAAEPSGSEEQRPEHHWRWRLRFAERIAADLDPSRFGVKGLYLFGSTKNAIAGPGSDIDLLVHFAGNDEQKRELMIWLDGWSRCLSEANYLRTGYLSERLLDVHLVSDEEIEKRSGLASKIGAITDPARPLPLKRADRGGDPNAC